MDAGALLVNSVSVQQARLDESSHIVLLLCAKCSSLLMFCCIMWLMESRGSVEVFKTWHKSLLTFSYFRPVAILECAGAPSKNSQGASLTRVKHINK